MSEKYNGWSNYATWLVKLWIDNTEQDYKFYSDLAYEVYQQAQADETFTKGRRARLDLADRLKENYEENNPLTDAASVWTDLLGASLAKVNWYEIANSLIEEGLGEEEAAE